MRLQTDPNKTGERAERLNQYFQDEVLDANGAFICRNQTDCVESLKCTKRRRTPTDIAHGQLHHVGHHYDTLFDGIPFRVVILGMSYGEQCELVALEKRRQTIAIDSGLKQQARGAHGAMPCRNPHMSGTTYTLRVAFGLGLDDVSQETEFLPINDGKAIHLFEAFALVDYLLCSATRTGRTKDYSTYTMRQRCTSHLTEALKILKPTLIVAQGAAGQWLTDNDFVPATDELIATDTMTIDDPSAKFQSVVLRLPHPSRRDDYGYGQSPSKPFLLNEVRPAVQAAVDLSLGIQ